ncbi:Mucin-5B [Desmophyllum pertusum]|uniref:Mucin-5B n=1 Tax=Desmophyllum pertusum TaxID=174260 RepID=A0A9W9ZAE2_9CNID|nr:Mucin-5B [Desmophyllum pertusum]
MLAVKTLKLACKRPVLKVDLWGDRNGQTVLSGTRADGKIHDCTAHVNLKYNGSADTCTTPSGSREFAHEGPASASFKYYVKPHRLVLFPGGEPHEARFGKKAWLPSGKLSTDKSQFLEVNFTSKVKVRRLSTKGRDESYVTRFILYFGVDGVRWNPYKVGGRIKEFPANTNAEYVQMITLPIPIEAKFIRINPVGWHNSIALKVEFYGCVLSQQPSSSGMSAFNLFLLID